MNQTCKVCGEPAAGFHFGAFTCEGCKSFFGRSYNNLSSISECKNNGTCVINKKNRTACKACRLRKCLCVGMSKSGSRYGRRSNWFKIHCLLQEQQQQQQAAMNNMPQPIRASPPLQQQQQQQQQPLGMGLLGMNTFHPSFLQLPRTREDFMLLGLDDYNSAPPVSSPESHNSDSSVEVNDARRLPLFPRLIPPTFLPPPGFIFPPSCSLYPRLLQSANNNNGFMKNHNPGVEAFNAKFLDAVLQSQRSPTPEPVPPQATQDDPIDLSMKTMSESGSSPSHSEASGSGVTEKVNGSEADEESDCDSERGVKRIRPTPLDLTRKK